MCTKFVVLDPDFLQFIIYIYFFVITDKFFIVSLLFVLNCQYFEANSNAKLMAKILITTSYQLQ